jgi:hypothetical protein
MATFDIVPEFEHVTRHQYKTIRSNFDLGYVQTRAFWPVQRRIFSLNWQNALDTEKEYIEAFFRERVGGGESFTYVPVDPVATPATAGTPGTTSGGALSSPRTYYYHFTWKNSNGETRAHDEGVQVIGTANTLFTLTVPKFPTGITSAVVYVSEVSGDTDKQVTEITDASNRIWTEPVGGLAAGDPPPSSNTATENLSCVLLSDEIPISKNSPVSWNISIEFEEVL